MSRLPDELVAKILVMANCPLASLQVCRQWRRLVVAHWAAFFWMDLYYPMGSPASVPRVSKDELGVSTTVLAILNERPPVMTDVGLKMGAMEKLLWKVHGTHLGVYFDGVTVSAQSRNRVLSAEADNAGSFGHVMKYADFYSKLAEKVGAMYIWGEFAGEGIQKGVGVSQLSRRMFIYGAELECGEALDAEMVRAAVVELRTNEPVYHLHEFETVPLRQRWRLSTR